MDCYCFFYCTQNPERSGQDPDAGVLNNCSVQIKRVTDNWWKSTIISIFRC